MDDPRCFALLRKAKQNGGDKFVPIASFLLRNAKQNDGDSFKGIFMFDKMKALLDMQKKMQEMKRELDNTTFEVESPDGLIKVTMNGSQEVKEFSIRADLKEADKSRLEKASLDAYNRAIRRAQDIAGQKMKDMTGFNLPGLM
jgi:DNA-binding YbaB/EbfC family protein